MVRVTRALRARALPPVRDLGLRLRSPLLLALAWRLATRPMAVPGLGAGRRPRRLVLLPKVGGTEDVVAALTGRGDVGIELVALPRAEVKHVWRRCMGRHAAGLGDTRYLSDDAAVEAAKRGYRDLLARTLRRYVAGVRVAGFVSANYAYYAERELAAAAEAVGVPFLVLHKESIRTPAQRPWFTRAYRELLGPFGGRSLAVYSAVERASMVAGGVAPAARIHVTGSPRIDELHRLRTDRSRGASDRGAADPTVTVLFAVDPAAGTWTPYDGSGAIDAPRWEELARRTESAFVATAAADPAHAYAIKVKLGRETATLGRLPAPLPPNLAVVAGGTATDLLRRTDVAVGFNSTVVLEAVAAGVPVLVPTFAEAAAAPEWTLPVTEAVVPLGTPEELGSAVAVARAEGPRSRLTSAQQRVLVDLVGDAEGGAADRVWRWLAAELGQTVG